MALKGGPLVRESSSPEETEAIGRDLAGHLMAGDILLLYGDLGAGKTVFARGIIQALPGGKNRPVRSPTFVYIQHHPTDPPVNHVDLYRLPVNSAPEELGLEEWGSQESVTLVEWAQRLQGRRFPQCIEVHIEFLGGDRREIRINKR
ncbi:tRNA (adenosine(37)-N6)-threonylcarbamoyltransferase complex ATPase subunit type 1 TsaE [Nitrospinota bacterium]